MKTKHVFIAGLCSLIVLCLIPATWWASHQVTSLFDLKPILPPAREDWLRCLPESLYNSSGQYWKLCTKGAIKFGFHEGLSLSSKLALLGFMCLAASILAIFMIEPETRIHIRGLHLYTGTDAVKKLASNFKKQIRKTQDTLGIELIKGVVLPFKSELRQWLVVGAMGSGKSVTILALLENWIRRNDLNLVLDPVGAFTSRLTWRNADGKAYFASILNPFDERSNEWWLGCDILTIEDARLFAQKFLSTNKSDTFWAKAATNIFIAVARSLQSDKGTNWSWHDLAIRLEEDRDQLLKYVDQHYPPARTILASKATETQDSVLMNFSTDFALIRDIACFWHNKANAKKFSIRSWLQGNSKNGPLVIVGWDASKKAASLAWTSSLYDIAGNTIASPAFIANKRINLVLDEFGAFPAKMEGIISCIERGREKKVAVLLGLQSPSQLKDVYGVRAEGFSSMIGNHIFSQTSPGKDAEDASKFLGEQTVREREITSNSSPSGGSQSIRWTEKKRPVFSPSEFSTQLGPNRQGVNVIYAGIGMDAYRLHIPYPLEQHSRPQFVPAKPIDLVSKPQTRIKPNPTLPSFDHLLKKQ